MALAPRLALDVPHDSPAPHASLVSLLTYVMSSDETYDGTGDLGFSIYDQICNLRRQAHSAAAQVRTGWCRMGFHTQRFPHQTWTWIR